MLNCKSEFEREVSWRWPRPKLGCRAKGEKNCKLKWINLSQ
jgi:hypothetical protein